MEAVGGDLGAAAAVNVQQVAQLIRLFYQDLRDDLEEQRRYAVSHNENLESLSSLTAGNRDLILSSQLQAQILALRSIERPHLDEATQKSIRSILSRLQDQKEVNTELAEAIQDTKKWLETLPLLKTKHAELARRVKALEEHITLLESQHQEFAKKTDVVAYVQKKLAALEKIDQIIDAKIDQMKISGKDTESVLSTDRWTDPKNQLCLLNPIGPPHSIFIETHSPKPGYLFAYDGSTMPRYFPLLKTLPLQLSELRITDEKNREKIENFIQTNIDYVCPCFNCLLMTKITRIGIWIVGIYTPRHMYCPLDSDCTCMTFQHRNLFLHSIELGFIKGRDLELSPGQQFYAQNLNKNKIIGTSNSIYCIVDRVPCMVINCTKIDGRDVYTYFKRDSSFGETTEENVYLLEIVDIDTSQVGWYDRLENYTPIQRLISVPSAPLPRPVVPLPVPVVPLPVPVVPLPSVIESPAPILSESDIKQILDDMFNKQFQGMNFVQLNMRNPIASFWDPIKLRIYEMIVRSNKAKPISYITYNYIVNEVPNEHKGLFIKNFYIITTDGLFYRIQDTHNQIRFYGDVPQWNPFEPYSVEKYRPTTYNDFRIKLVDGQLPRPINWKAVDQFIRTTNGVVFHNSEDGNITSKVSLFLGKKKRSYKKKRTQRKTRARERK